MKGTLQKTFWDRLPLILLLTLALCIRIAFIPNPGFEADVAFWKGWGLAAADKGAVWSILNTNNNYPTPFAYTLGAMTTMYRILGGDPHNFNEYWTNTNLRFLIASKIFPVIADFGIFFTILWIGKKFGKLFHPVKEEEGKPKQIASLFLLLATLYIFNPVSIMDGSWWGQVDSMGVILFLFAFVMLLLKKPFLGGVVFMLAMMTKLQNMIYGPIFFVFVWQQFGLSGLFQAMTGATVGFFGLNIEFFFSKNMSKVLESLSQNYDYFPYMSLHAYNIWWIVSKGDGMGVSDKLLTIGSMNAKSFGTILFSGTYLLAILQMILPTILGLFSMKKIKNQTNEIETHLTPTAIFHFFIGMVLVNAGFFLFQTQSHERYAFPLTVFLLFLAPFLEKKKRKIFLIAYSIWSVLYFYNLHTAFAVNYPDDVFQFLRGWFTTPVPTITVAFIFVTGFIALLIFLHKAITPLPFLITGIFCIGLIFMKNLNFIEKKPISLTDMTPWYSRQDYGQRVKDMPVNSSGGPKSWTFLSTQYTFYRHGIGTHANSEIRYDIGRRFHEFTTDFGIDTGAGTQASATFAILGDERVLFQSKKVGRFDMPQFVKVNVDGVKTLRLITGDAGDGINDDHTDWLDPKLYP